MQTLVDQLIAEKLSVSPHDRQRGLNIRQMQMLVDQLKAEELSVSPHDHQKRHEHRLSLHSNMTGSHFPHGLCDFEDLEREIRKVDSPEKKKI
jgi:hypothetical protein